VLTRQQRIAEMAKKYGDSPLSTLSHNIDLVWLHEAFRRLNKNSATGVDGQSVAADDFVLLVESREDAERMLEILSQRFEQYGLTIHPEKTRIVDFRHPWGSGRKPETFDFLGFTHYWGKTRNGGFAVKKKTASKKLTLSLKGIHQWCKENRHRPLKWQHSKLSKKLLGHYGYYGVVGNSASLSRFLHFTKRHWRYWLNRRSRERNGMTWDRFNKLTNEYLKLPPPRIVHKQRLLEQCSFIL
jgi:RNA-directed DNA polymerase